MSLASERGILGIRRRFTTPDTDPYDQVAWEHRTSRLVDHPHQFAFQTSLGRVVCIAVSNT